jgi:hypothetical protein
MQTAGEAARWLLLVLDLTGTAATCPAPSRAGCCVSTKGEACPTASSDQFIALGRRGRLARSQGGFGRGRSKMHGPEPYPVTKMPTL